MFHENWGFHSLFLQIFFLTRIINSIKKRGRKEEKEEGRKGRKEEEKREKEGRERQKTILEQKTKDKEKLLKNARGLIILPIEEQR